MSSAFRKKIATLLAAEQGQIIKEHGGKYTVALAYPNQYHVGMSNLGFQKIYVHLNAQIDVVCERAFLPDAASLREFRQGRTPLFSFETQTPLLAFDVLAFSLSFESDYLNLLRILELAHIPLSAAERDERHPLILCGGVCTYMNPEPIAEFADLFAIGEGEEMLDELLQVFRERSPRHTARTQLLDALAQVEGVYVPSGYAPRYHADGTLAGVAAAPGHAQPVKRRIVRKLNEHPTTTQLVTRESEFGSMYMVEIGRGCGRGCRFCAAGYVYRPPRNYSKELVLAEVAKGLPHRSRIGLMGTATYDHPYIDELATEVVRLGGRVSVASLRIDSLTSPMLTALSQSGHRTVSLGIEGGSERMRHSVYKKLSDDLILDGVRMIVEHGIPNIKLYFQVGLPGESEADIEAIVQLAKRAKHTMLQVARSKHRLGSLTLSVNPFVPKPGTAYQWERYEDIGVLNRRLKQITRALRKVENITVIHELPKWSFVQALMSLGDRRVGTFLRGALALDGDWFRAFREVNQNPEFYVYRRKAYDEILPWDIVDLGLKKSFLQREHEKSLATLARDPGGSTTVRIAS